MLTRCLIFVNIVFNYSHLSKTYVSRTLAFHIDTHFQNFIIFYAASNFAGKLHHKKGQVWLTKMCVTVYTNMTQLKVLENLFLCFDAKGYARLRLLQSQLTNSRRNVDLL